MERSKQETLRHLKDQMDKINPVPPDTIDLGNYKALQFQRTLKNYDPKSIPDRYERVVFKVKSTHDLNRLPTTKQFFTNRESRMDSHDKACKKGEIGHTYRLMLGQEEAHIKSYERFSQTAGLRRHQRGGSVININEDLAKAGIYPTDIRHLEKIVKFTTPNHRNSGGGKTCKRES